MASFADRDQIKRMLGIADNTCTGTTRFDGAIDDLLPVIDQMVLDELGLSAGLTTTYSEKIDVTFGGETEIALKYTPVSSVVALTIGGTLQTIDSEFYLNKPTGTLRLSPLSALLPSGRSIVEVTYKAGFSSVPADLKYAGNLIAVSMFNQQSHVGYKSEKTQAYSYSMDHGTGSQIPKIAQRILNKHRRIFALGGLRNDYS